MQRSASASGARILVVEDDLSIRDIVATALRFHGHSVTESSDGTTGLAVALRESLDILVLDVMIPGVDGFELCRQLREAGRSVPVIFLTAIDEESQRVRGFLSGGDDYLAKPFSVDELILRISAILRRSSPSVGATALGVGDLTLDLSGREARRGGTRISLSPTEFGLLHYLMLNAGTVVSKAQILANVWDYDYDGGDNVVEIYVGYLRRKIDDGQPPLIHTKRGVGYVLRVDA